MTDKLELLINKYRKNIIYCKEHGEMNELTNGKYAKSFQKLKSEILKEIYSIISNYFAICLQKLDDNNLTLVTEAILRDRIDFIKLLDEGDADGLVERYKSFKKDINFLLSIS